MTPVCGRPFFTRRSSTVRGSPPARSGICPLAIPCIGRMGSARRYAGDNTLLTQLFHDDEQPSANGAT